MSKLTKAQAKAHKAACDILAKENLSWDDRWFVLENWQESATHINSIAGAFFTPANLAADFAIDVHGHHIIDLCAGIGTLSFVHYSRCRFADRYPEVVCVEKNPGYVSVGRKIFPEATWIEGDIFNLPDLGRFNTAISNPPFGATQRGGWKAPRYTGDRFEYHVIDIASDLADYGVFIVPQMSAPFAFSGKQYYRETPSDHYSRFLKQTGCALTNGCGVDCEYHRKSWHGVAPAVEIVLCDFETARSLRHPSSATDQIEMFREAAE